VSYSPLAWRLFDLANRRWRRGRLDGIHLAGLPPGLRSSPGPVLVVANHSSWWDGFVVRELHRRLRPDQPFLTVMLEEQLRRYPFLRRLGGVGLVPGSTASLRGLLERLGRVREESPGAMVLLFPQGRLWPSHRRPLGFLPGLRAFRRTLRDSWVLPVGIHLAPGARPGQEAWISVGRPVAPGDPEGADPGAMETRVTAELDAILLFLARWGEEAAARWPSEEGRLPERGAG
jgi:1-acyl-sn-glycerol-3-phosphate acyltransferase